MTERDETGRNPFLLFDAEGRFMGEVTNARERERMIHRLNLAEVQQAWRWRMDNPAADWTAREEKLLRARERALVRKRLQAYRADARQASFLDEETT